MPKVSPVQNSFNGGELSPLLYGRTDFDGYKSSVATCLNLIPIIQGALTRRPGSYFVDEVKDSTKATRIVPFKFNTQQAYIIEFGDQYVRFKRNDAPITEAALVITGITQANPGVLTYTGTDPSNGDHIDLSGIVGMTQLNGRRVVVANVNAGANTFELKDLAGNNINTTALTAYVSGGSAARVYTVVTPYLEADLFQLKFTQSADVLYIFHPDYAPRKLSRTSHTSWTLATIGFLDGPYLTVNATATTLTPAATTGVGVNVTASAVTGINSDAGFKTTDVGRLIRIRHSSTWGYAKITAWTSTTVVVVTIINDFGAATASAEWRLGLYSDTTAYPACATFYGDRLCIGGPTAVPQRFDMSRTGDYENFEPTNTDGTVVDDHAISRSLNSDDVQSIIWMKGDDKALLVGTSEGEWAIRPSSQSEAVSPTNIDGKQSTNKGSANVQAVRAGGAMLFVQKAKRKLREVSYVFQVDGYRAPDMTVMAEHITKGATRATSGMKELAYAQEPVPIVWAVRNDGVLLGFTYDSEQKVIGWHRHTFGGYSDAGHTASAKVESVAVIPASDGSRDETWVVVQRYINGRSVRYVEYLTPLWERGDTQEDAVFWDCAATYDGVATMTLTGLHHLAGETVQVKADGAAHVDVLVSATGTLALTRSSQVVQVGYSYHSDGKCLRPEAGAADGTAQGKIQRTNHLVFRVHDTLGLKAGPTFETTGYGKLTEVTFRTSADDTGAAVPLFSGDVQLTWEGDYTSENYVCWRFDGGFPGTVLAIMPQLTTQDR